VKRSFVKAGGRWIVRSRACHTASIRGT
jgi:hypothetical protein